MKTLLIIEDDQDIRELLALQLGDEYKILAAASGEIGLELIQKQGVDALILDLMLPGIDGLRLCQKLRALEYNQPVLMLTAKAEEFDKVVGLESGADDYLTKPFGIRELKARMAALLRREDRINSKKESPSILERGVLKINVENHSVFQEDKRLDLTPKEFELLLLLAENPGKSYSREQLLKLIWGYDFGGYEHTVNSHINRLRSKIESKENNTSYILTTWGVGYRFNEAI